MATKLDIINTALSLISVLKLNSIDEDDNSPIATTALLHWGIVVPELLSRTKWSFAIRGKLLAKSIKPNPAPIVPPPPPPAPPPIRPANVDVPGEDLGYPNWKYVYNMPLDLVTFLRCYSENGVTIPLQNYQVIGRSILTDINSPNIYIEYITQDISPEAFSPEFTSWLTYRLAINMSYELCGSESKMVSLINVALQKEAIAIGINNSKLPFMKVR